MEPTESRLSERGILVAKSLVHTKTGELPLRLANMSSELQKIYSGTLAAKCKPVDIVMVDMFSDTQNGDVSEDIGPSQKCETIKNKHCTPIYGSLASVSDEHASIPNHLKDLFESSKTLLSEAEAEALSSLLVK